MEARLSADLLDSPMTDPGTMIEDHPGTTTDQDTMIAEMTVVVMTDLLVGTMTEMIGIVTLEGIGNMYLGIDLLLAEGMMTVMSTARPGLGKLQSENGGEIRV